MQPQSVKLKRISRWQHFEPGLQRKDCDQSIYSSSSPFLEERLLRRLERRLDFLPERRFEDLLLAERRLEDLLLAERRLALRLEARLLFGAMIAVNKFW